MTGYPQRNVRRGHCSQAGLGQVRVLFGSPASIRMIGATATGVYWGDM
jgi:hypothetical protein